MLLGGGVRTSGLGAEAQFLCDVGTGRMIAVQHADEAGLFRRVEAEGLVEPDLMPCPHAAVSSFSFSSKAPQAVIDIVKSVKLHPQEPTVSCFLSMAVWPKMGRSPGLGELRFLVLLRDIMLCWSRWTKG